MIKLKVDPDEALSWLEGINNEAFRKALRENWHVDDNGNVKAQSVLWLFCWAKTGMGSIETAEEPQLSSIKYFPLLTTFLRAGLTMSGLEPCDMPRET